MRPNTLSFLPFVLSKMQRLFAFFGNVWSFILTLVRSLLALFSFRRRASDPFTLPRVNRTPKDALSRLRPILLTPRSITAAQRAQSMRTRSATSTLLPGPDVPAPQRTSPKLDPHDAELGLSVTACDQPGLSATSSRQGTPDSTSLRTSVLVSPLTPPDRCYLAPLPSATDCPYTEPWPTSVTLDRGKPRPSGSPLKASINTDPSFPGPMGSPPGRWGPVQIWMSTPCKNDSSVPDPALSPFDLHKPSPALEKISHALISRSQSSFQPYDDASNSPTSSDASLCSNGPFAGTFRQPGPTRERHHRTHTRAPRSKTQPYPQFHHPDAYAYAWRRHGARLPGKLDRTHAYAHSHSHMDLPANEWYDADAYAPSPVSALSPPRSESATEDEDEMPLGRLRERLARRSAAVGLGVPVGAGSRKAAAMSPRTRRMSEGCLLAISESTPTRIGVGARSSRHVISLALDGHGYTSKDWLEALSLRYSSDQKDALASEPEPSMVVPSVDVVVG